MATIDTIIKNATVRANTLSNSAWRALDNAATIAAGFERIEWADHSFIQQAQEVVEDIAVPELEDSYNLPVNSAQKPRLNSLFIPATPNYPERINIQIDDLFRQDAPDFNARGFNESAPDINIDDIYSGISEPNIAEIEAPEISELEIDEAPELVIPEFISTFENPVIDEPIDLQATYKAEYDSVLPVMRDFIDNNISAWIREYDPQYHSNVAKLESKLSLGMESGLALSDEFEDALYNRARARAEGEKGRVDREILQGMSKRGFSLPSSVLSAGLQNSHQAAANNIAQQSTELAIERAKLEIQHVQFSMQLSQGVMQVMIGASVQYAGVLATINAQAIEHSKNAATFLAEIYEQLLKRANLSIDVYKIEIAIYETQIKSALAGLDGFKLELEAARLEKDVEAINVDIYAKRVDAENIKIIQYTALINAASEKAGLEKLKIEIFGEQVRAYVAETTTKEIELKAYTAALQGDEAKLNGEVAKIEAYSKQVDAEANKSQVEIEHMKAIDSHNRSLTDIYNAELSLYKIEIDAEGQRFKGSIDANKAKLAAYIGDKDIRLQKYKVNYDKARLDLSASDSQFKADVQVSIENAKNFLASVNMQTDTAVSAGGIYGTMASSALSSLNTMASVVGKE